MPGVPVGDEGASDFLNTVHAVGADLAYARFYVLNPDFIDKPQGLAKCNGARIVGCPAYFKLAGRLVKGPVVDGRRAGILPVSAPAAFRDRCIQISCVALF